MIIIITIIITIIIIIANNFFFIIIIIIITLHLLQLATQLAWTKSCSSLLKILDEPAEESGIKIPDLMDDAGLLEWAGVTIGKAEVRVYFIIICN